MRVARWRVAAPRWLTRMVSSEVTDQALNAAALAGVLVWMGATATALRLCAGVARNHGSPERPAIRRAELLVRLAALADDTRLRMLELLAQHGEVAGQEIMAHLQLSQSGASRHLNNLKGAGLVLERRGDGAAKRYSLTPGGVQATFQALDRALAGDPALADQPAADPAVAPQLQRFMDDTGRLIRWPAREKDRLVVLAHIASAFEWGRRYSAGELHERLDTVLHAERFDSDSVTIRRALCDYRFLERERDGSLYWRVQRDD